METVLILLLSNCVGVEKYFLLLTHLDSSKQRTRLRKKIASEKNQLKSSVERYNELIAGEGGAPLTVDVVLSGGLPRDTDENEGN